jgi:hypothetical protein
MEQRNGGGGERNLHLQLEKFDVFDDLFKHGCLVSLHRRNAGFTN